MLHRRRRRAALETAFFELAPAAPPNPSRDLIVGGIWLAAGLLITLVSYSLASQAGGGRYVITTGAIAYGAVRVVRGLARAG